PKQNYRYEPYNPKRFQHEQLLGFGFAGSLPPAHKPHREILSFIIDKVKTFNAKCYQPPTSTPKWDTALRISHTAAASSRRSMRSSAGGSDRSMRAVTPHRCIAEWIEGPLFRFARS